MHTLPTGGIQPTPITEQDYQHLTDCPNPIQITINNETTTVNPDKAIKKTIEKLRENTTTYTATCTATTLLCAIIDPISLIDIATACTLPPILLHTYQGPLTEELTIAATAIAITTTPTATKLAGKYTTPTTIKPPTQLQQTIDQIQTILDGLEQEKGLKNTKSKLKHKLKNIQEKLVVLLENFREGHIGAGELEQELQGIVDTHVTGYQGLDSITKELKEGELKETLQKLTGRLKALPNNIRKQLGTITALKSWAKRNRGKYIAGCGVAGALTGTVTALATYNPPQTTTIQIQCNQPAKIQKITQTPDTIKIKCKTEVETYQSGSQGYYLKP